MTINHSGEYVLVVCPNPAVDIYASLSQFEIGVPNRLLLEERYPGGKGIHVAMALSELGVNVVVIGLWGSVTGEWIKKECNRYYPNIKFDGPILDQWSRSCYTFKSEDAFDDTEILGTGPTLAKEDSEALFKITETYLTKAKALNLSGSWPSGAPTDGYKTLIEMGQNHSVPTFLDCTGSQLDKALEAKPFCVHLNRKEITSHFNLENFDLAQKQILESCEVAAITDGSRGLYLSSQSQRAHTLAKIEKVISTIGSGDCLFAGIIAGFVQKKSFEDIAKLGASSGAANCLRKELGMLNKNEVDVLFELCQVG